MELGEKCLQAQNKDKITFYSLVEAKVPIFVSKSLEERMFVVDSGASMHVLSKKDLSSAELDTLRRSMTPQMEKSKQPRMHKYMFTWFIRDYAIARGNASSFTSASASSSSSTSRTQDMTSRESSEIGIDPTVSGNRNKTNPNIHSQ